MKDVPFVSEDKMVELGAILEKASELWGVSHTSHVSFRILFALMDT